MTVGATRIAEDIKATLDAWLEGFQKDTSAWESGVEGSWVIEDMSTGTGMLPHHYHTHTTPSNPC